MQEEKEQNEKFGSGALDSDMALIRRKTISIKSDVVADMLTNLGSISESVATFQKMSEQSSENDIALQYQN